MSLTVSVVVINYQGRRWLPRCLASIAGLTHAPEETIVIDNASRDGSADEAGRQFPWVRIVKNRRNVGFAKACNQAFALSRGDAVAILNNDVELDPNWLTVMVEGMMARPGAAALGSKLRLMKPRQALAGAGACMNWQGFGFDRGVYEWDTGQYDRPSRMLAACAAATLIRRSAFNEVGPFDARFFMYHEDVDWCWRAWLRGFDVWYLPEALAYHRLEGSTTRYLGARAKEQLGQRNRIRSLLKCYEWTTLRRYLFSLRLWHFGRPTLYSWLRLVMPVLWNVWWLPSTLVARRRIQRRRRRSDDEMRHVIWPSDVPMRPPRHDGPPRLLTQRGRTPMSVIAVGMNDAAALGSGWYLPEPVPGDRRVKIRWSQQRASFNLWQAPGATELFVTIYSAAKFSGVPLSGELFIDGERQSHFASNEDGWIDLHVDLVAPFEGRWITVALAVTHPWRRAQAFGGSDHRELGLGLYRAGCIVPRRRHTAVVAIHPPVSIIVPTHNRAVTLQRTLSALLDQVYPASEMEIIVVDDGSTDDTARCVSDLQVRVTGRIRYLRQEKRGAAAARNLGIRSARTELVICLDDDIVPESHLVAEHVAAHRRLNWSDDVAVVGYSRWPIHQRRTVFLDYIGEDGPQFAYRSMVQGMALPCFCFYSSNLSLHRYACGMPVVFDEALPNVWDDTELGYRLMQRGLRLYYNPRAIGHHHHVRGLKEFMARQAMAGQYAVSLAHRYPELGDRLKVARRLPLSWDEQTWALLRLIACGPTRLPGGSVLKLWYWWRLSRAYQDGVRLGRRQPLVRLSDPDASWSSVDAASKSSERLEAVTAA